MLLNLDDAIRARSNPNIYRFEHQHLDLKGKVQPPRVHEDITIALRATREGTYSVTPRTIFQD